MVKQGRNATRAGRSIENPGDRENPAADRRSDDRNGRRMPEYSEDVLEKETTAAPDHLQVSAIADVGEDGRIDVDESEVSPKARKKR